MTKKAPKITVNVPPKVEPVATTPIEPIINETTHAPEEVKKAEQVVTPTVIKSSVAGAYKWATNTKFKGVHWMKGTPTPELSVEERNMLYTSNLITL